jgi:hypothetical protein
MTVNAHAADHRSQAITLPVATEHRETWVREDLEFVQMFTDERDEDLALALGRTLYAIRSIRAVIDERIERDRLRRASRPRELTITSYDEWERSFG